MDGEGEHEAQAGVALEEVEGLEIRSHGGGAGGHQGSVTGGRA